MASPEDVSRLGEPRDSLQSLVHGLAALSDLEFEALERNLAELGTRRPRNFEAVLDTLSVTLGDASESIDIATLVRLIAYPDDLSSLLSLEEGAKSSERLFRLRALYHYQATTWIGMGTFGERNWRFATILPVILGRELNRPFLRVEITRLDDQLLELEVMPSGLLNLASLFVRELTRVPEPHLSDIAGEDISELLREVEALRTTVQNIHSSSNDGAGRSEEEESSSVESADTPAKEAADDLREAPESSPESPSNSDRGADQAAGP